MSERGAGPVGGDARASTPLLLACGAVTRAQLVGSYCLLLLSRTPHAGSSFLPFVSTLLTQPSCCCAVQQAGQQQAAGSGHDHYCAARGRSQLLTGPLQAEGVGPQGGWAAPGSPCQGLGCFLPCAWQQQAAAAGGEWVPCMPCARGLIRGAAPAHDLELICSSVPRWPAWSIIIISSPSGFMCPHGLKASRELAPAWAPHASHQYEGYAAAPAASASTKMAQSNLLIL